MTMSPNNKNNDNINHHHHHDANSSSIIDLTKNGINSSNSSSNIDFDVTLASPMMRQRLSSSQLSMSTTTTNTTNDDSSSNNNHESYINRNIFCGLSLSPSMKSPKSSNNNNNNRKSLSPTTSTTTTTTTAHDDLYNTMKDNSIIRRELFKQQQQQQQHKNEGGTSVERADDEDDDDDDGGTTSTLNSSVDGCTTTTTAGDDDYSGDEVVVVDKQQVATMVAPTTTLPHDNNSTPPPPPPPRVMSGPLEQQHHHQQQQFLSSFNRDAEVSTCYNNYRLKKEFIDDIVRQMDCTMPLYFDSNVVKNVVSEPMASQFNVRSPHYTTDQIKIPSAPSVFSVLGVDHIIRPKHVSKSSTLHSSALENSYVKRLRRVCRERNVVTPFLLIINLNLPWGNLITYMYRPDAHGSTPFLHPPTSSSSSPPFEKLWHQFLTQPSTRTNTLKLIPHVTKGPWLVKKLVGQQPCIVGRKLPVRYYGYDSSPENNNNDNNDNNNDHNYLEITMDVTKGNAVANKIASAMSKSADAVTVDLAFVLEGSTTELLPERVLGVYRLHHVCVKEWMGDVWDEEVRRRERVRSRMSCGD